LKDKIATAISTVLGRKQEILRLLSVETSEESDSHFLDDILGDFLPYQAKEINMLAAWPFCKKKNSKKGKAASSKNTGAPPTPSAPAMTADVTSDDGKQVNKKDSKKKSKSAAKQVVGGVKKTIKVGLIILIVIIALVIAGVIALLVVIFK
jgi:hypothetical protein